MFDNFDARRVPVGGTVISRHDGMRYVVEDWMDLDHVQFRRDEGRHVDHTRAVDTETRAFSMDYTFPLHRKPG